MDFGLSKIKHQLSNLLLLSGGHPRTLSKVLGQLSFWKQKFEEGLTKKQKKAYFKQTANADDRSLFAFLESDLFRKDFATAVDAVCTSGMADIRALGQNRKMQDRFTPSFYQDMVNPFGFPATIVDALDHSTTLDNIEKGICSFVPVENDPQEDGLSIIPFPVINSLAQNRLRSPLICLSKSIIGYSSLVDDELSPSGKRFEICIANALQFYFSNRVDITLRSICRAVGPSPRDSVFDLPLLTLPSSQMVDLEGIKVFPTAIKSDNQLPHLECANPALLSQLKPGVYLPSDESNSGDLVVILEVADSPKKVVIFFEMKDWTSLLKEGFPMIAHWRWSKQFLRSTGLVPLAKHPKQGDGYGTINHSNLQKKSYLGYLKDAGFEVGFVLFSSNRQRCVEDEGAFSGELTLIPSDTTKQDHPRQLRSDEALMDLRHMKMWFPTVAYNVMAAHKLNQFLCPDAD